MILSKAPLRMSYVGGGSDIPNYYREGMGAVLSTTINRYVYVAINRKFDGRIRINYSKTEDIDTIERIEHPIVREALALMEIKSGVEIASMADIPAKGSGLGSSSSFTVALLNALHAYKNQHASKETLAQQSCEIELNRCREPIGKQDQYAAAYGGLNLIRFHPDETVSVDPVICKPHIKNIINESTLVFFTGRTRSASAILNDFSIALKGDKQRSLMDKMVSLAFDLKKELESGSIQNFGAILDENWRLKYQLANGVSDTQINEWYSRGISAGATGGKLLGAGNGGFLMFFAPPEKHNNIKLKLKELRPINLGFDTNGAQIVFYKHDEASA